MPKDVIAADEPNTDHVKIFATGSVIARVGESGVTYEFIPHDKPTHTMTVTFTELLELMRVGNSLLVQNAMAEARRTKAD